MSKARRIVKDLFSLFYDEPHLLPEEGKSFATNPAVKQLRVSSVIILLA